jgi:plasmid maintenance system antidote protein VapI
MANIKKTKDEDFNVEIGLKKGKKWSDEKLAKIKAFAKNESKKRAPERQLLNDLLSIQYQMEEYLESKENDAKELHTLQMFLKEYLTILDLPLKRFAISIDTTDSNLKKYLSGERTFNADLAMKFGYFFHTPPDLWLRVHLKNQLDKLKQEKKQIKKYEKYDFVNVI